MKQPGQPGFMASYFTLPDRRAAGFSMKCPRCDHDNFSATRFCVECGWDLEKDPAAQPDDESDTDGQGGAAFAAGGSIPAGSAGDAGAPESTRQTGDPALDPLTAESTPITWAFHTGARVTAPPLLTADSVFFGGSDRKVYALDAASGSLRWAYAVDGKPESGLALSGDIVFCGSSDNSLYAIDAATGEERWYFTTRGSITARPVVTDGLVLFGSHDGDFYAVDAATGSERWRVETGSRITDACAVAGDLAYFTNRVGVLIAVRTGDGTVVHDLNHLQSPTAPVGSNGIIVVGSGRGVQAIDADTGRDAWYTEALVQVRRPLAAGDGVACFEAGDYLYALASETGELLWQHLLPQPLTYPAAVTDGSVYFVDSNHVFTLLSLTGGIEQKSWYAGCRASCGAPAVAGGRAAMGCDDNLLGIDLGLLPAADGEGRGPWNRDSVDDGANAAGARSVYSNAQKTWHLYPLFLLGGMIYFYYWFFRNWKYMKLAGIREVNPGLRLLGMLSPLLFGIFFGFIVAAGGGASPQAGELLLAGALGFTILTLYLMYDLFRDIRNQANAAAVKSYSLGFITAGFFTLQNLPFVIGQSLAAFGLEMGMAGALLLLGAGFAGTAASVFVLSFVQKAANRLWLMRNPGLAVRKRFTSGEKLLMIVGGLLQAAYLLTIITTTVVG